MAPPDAIDPDTVVVANAIEVLYSMQQTSNSLEMGLDNNPVDEGFPDGRPASCGLSRTTFRAKRNISRNCSNQQSRNTGSTRRRSKSRSRNLPISKP